MSYSQCVCGLFCSQPLQHVTCIIPTNYRCVIFSVRLSESAAHKINHIEAIVAWFENSLLRASPVIRETSALSHCQTLWVYRTRGMATSSHRECLIMTYGFISAAYTAARLCRRLYSQCLCDLFCSQPLRRRLFYSIV